MVSIQTNIEILDHTKQMNYSQNDELTELQDRMCRGDEKAYQIIFHRYYFRVMGLVRQYIDEAEIEDVTQEIFIQVFKNVDRIKDVNAFESYLFRAAKNRSINWLRKNHRIKKMIELFWYASSLWKERNEQNKHDSLVRLQSVLDSIPSRDKQYIDLFYIQKRSRSEIAGILKESPSTVYRRMASAKAALLKATDEQGLQLEFIGRHDIQVK